MKPLLLLVVLSVLLLPGCAGMPTICGERTYEFQVPSTIPFVSGSFIVKRSSDHVDCEREPGEREIDD